MEFQDQTCVITGGAQGIGLALAEAFVRAGARVALNDVDPAALQSATGSFPGGRLIGVPGSVASPDDIEQLAAQAEARLGPIAIWVNNAGLARHRWITDYTEGDMDLMMAVNLKGTVLGSQAALRRMAPRRAGHIVNIISTAGLRGIPTESFYCATKWAVRGFTQALAEEAAPCHVRVTAILPGGVATLFWDAASPDRPVPREKFLAPHQVADAVLAALRADDTVCVRELVLRSMQDSDFAAGTRRPG